jgi:hypothetical protein
MFVRGVFQIVALEPSPKWRGQGEVIKKQQFEMHPLLEQLIHDIKNQMAHKYIHIVSISYEFLRHAFHAKLHIFLHGVWCFGKHCVILVSQNAPLGYFLRKLQTKTRKIIVFS